MTRTQSSARLCVVVLAAAAACGCAAPRVERLTVTLDKGWSYKSGFLPSIEVHLVGVDARELGTWETYSMSSYWSPGDRLRESAEKYVMKFGEGLPSSYCLADSDREWKKWNRHRATHFVILADLPGAYPDQPGSDDPRRNIVPLQGAARELEVISRPVR